MYIVSLLCCVELYEKESLFLSGSVCVWNTVIGPWKLGKLRKKLKIRGREKGEPGENMEIVYVVLVKCLTSMC